MSPRSRKAMVLARPASGRPAARALARRTDTAEAVRPARRRRARGCAGRRHRRAGPRRGGRRRRRRARPSLAIANTAAAAETARVRRAGPHGRRVEGAAREAGEAGRSPRRRACARPRRGSGEGGRRARTGSRSKSPIAGRVLTPGPPICEGGFVTAGTPLLEIGDCSKLVAELPVSERLLDDLAVRRLRPRAASASVRRARWTADRPHLGRDTRQPALRPRTRGSRRGPRRGPTGSWRSPSSRTRMARCGPGRSGRPRSTRLAPRSLAEPGASCAAGSRRSSGSAEKEKAPPRWRGPLRPRRGPLDWLERVDCERVAWERVAWARVACARVAWARVA